MARTEHTPSRREICINSGTNTLSVALSPVERAEWRFENGETQRTRILPNTTSIRGAHDVVWGRWDQTCKCIHIGLSPALLADIARQVGAPPPILRPSEGLHDKTILDAALLLSGEIDNWGLGGDLMVQSVANILAVHVLRNYADVIPRSFDNEPPGLDRARLNRVLDFAETNLGAPLSLDVLASVAAVSPYHFARSFKLSMGCSPHQWVIQRRMDRAKTLLRNTQLPIADVARQVGLSNHSHFATRFRGVVGCSPKVFRRQS